MRIWALALMSVAGTVSAVAGARRIDALLLLVAAVWGSSYLAAKTATQVLPVPLVLFARYGLSALSAGLVASARRPTRRWSGSEVRAGTALGCTQAAVLVVETYGIAHTSAANAGLIISVTILLTPMLDRSGERLPARFFLAAGVSVAGVGMLVCGGQLHTPRIGDLLMLTAAVVRAAHVVLLGRLAGSPSIRALPLTAVQTMIGSLLLLPFAGPRMDRLGAIDAQTWVALAYLALGCSVFAFLVQTWAVQRSSPSRASLLLGTEPVWAVVAGLWLGGERLGPVGAAGAVVVVAGTYWGQAIERGHRRVSEVDIACPTPTRTSI